MARRALVLAGVLCIAALGVYALGGWARVAVHLAVNQVCMGVSAGKIGFVLIFMALYFWRGAWVAGEGERREGLAWFAGFAGVGLAAAMASHLFYVNATGLGVADVGFHWRRGVNSVNAITHIHTSKVPIAMVLESLGSRELMTRFDTGAAFLGAVPRWLGGVIGACFVGALGVAVW
ncbi:MAG: hypothetical protein ACOYN0_18920, partial [Phycisphaerales bacterium]